MKKLSIVFYLVSLLCYILAIINFKNDSSMAIVWMCIGSTFLCVGSSEAVKQMEKKE